MSIKCFVAGLTVGGGQPDYPNGPFVGAVHAVTNAVFENGALVPDPGGTNSGIDILPGSTRVDLFSGDTLGIIRTRLQAVAVASWNSQTDRTDGNTIMFVWLDDKGLL